MWSYVVRGLGLVLVTAILLIIVAFCRYNISYKIHPELAQLQRTMGVHNTDLTMEVERPVIVGHRGSGLTSIDGQTTIGNTITTIENGIKANVDWIEIDILRSSDGHLVVFHDQSVERKTDGQGAVSSLSLAQLQALTIQVSEGDKTIPTLQAVLEQFSQQGTHFILDIKAHGIRDAVLDSIAAAKVPKQQVIIFGKHTIISEYTDSGYDLGYTVMWGVGWNKQRFLLDPSFLIDRMKGLGKDGKYLVLPDVLLNQGLIEESMDNGFPVWTFRSDDPRDWQDSFARGVSGLIVDEVLSAKTMFLDGRE